MGQLMVKSLCASVGCCFVFAFAALASPATVCQNSTNIRFLELAIPDGRDAKVIELCVGQMVTLEMSESLGAMAVGSPQVVAANILTSQRTLFTAVQPGETSVVALSADREREAAVSFLVKTGSLLSDPPPSSAQEETAGQIIVTGSLGTKITVWRGTLAGTVICADTCVE